jgi:hypothetical protein
LKEIFAPVSSRLIRVLLVDPQKRWFVSDLAEEADISLALAYRIVEKLLAEKHLEKATSRQIIVKSPGELLDRWRQVTYTPKRFGFYSFIQDSSEVYHTLDSLRGDTHMQYALGFFSGAGLIAPFIRGVNVLQLYIDKESDIPTYTRMLDLQPAETGANVELYLPNDKGVFYGVQQKPVGEGSMVNVVSTVQLYIDLYNNPARGQEQAEHLREVILKY